MERFNALYVLPLNAKKRTYSRSATAAVEATFPAATSLNETTMSSFLGELTK